MTARKQDAMTPIQILAKGCFTAGLSVVLFPAPWAGAESSLKPGSRQPAAAKQDTLTPPRAFSGTTVAARPLTLDEGVIQSVSSDRRLQRMKRKEQLLQGKADLGAAKTGPQEPQQPTAQPQQQIVRPPMAMQPAPQMNFAPATTQQPQFSAPTAQSNAPEMDMATGEFVEPSLEGDDRSPDPQPRPMTKVELELQRLYAEHNMQVPTMPQVVPVTPQAQAAQPQMNAAQPQQGMAQQLPQQRAQRPMAPSKAAPMARAKMLQPQPAPQDTASTQPAQEPAKPKKSFLGFFGIKRHAAPTEQPPEEPDPYVPVNARPMPGMTTAEVIAPPPATEKLAPQPDATRGAESVVITEPPAVHPLATPPSRNYSQQLFGAPTTAPAAAPHLEAPVAVIAQPTHSDLGIEELDREPAGADEEDLSFDSTGTPTMQLGPAPGVASLPDAEPAIEAPAELPSPFSGMKLNERAYGADPADPYSDQFQKAPEEPSLDLDSAAMAPGEPREVSLGNTPRKTGVPVLIAPGPTQVRSAKLEMIASRAGLPGLKGFCPVRLRDHRQLVDGESRWSCEYEGRTYHMSSSAACERFKADPAAYAPAARGLDSIELAAGHEVEGSLDNAVWYQSRLYLFASQQNQELFVNSPQAHTAR